MMGRKCVLRDAKAIEKRVQAYFDHCDSTRQERTLKSGDLRIRQEHPSMIGLAVWLGISKVTLYSYIRGEIEGADERIVSLLSRARDRIEEHVVQAAANGDYDARIAGLVLSGYGYGKPQEEQTVTVRVQAATPKEVDDWSR
jgi:hypothetical protein|nr:MAG TPA: DNA packaging protein gp3 [Caudoviricetes sp.]